MLSLREKVREEDHHSQDEMLLPTSKAMYASVRGQKGRQQMGLQRGGPVQSRIQQSRSTSSTQNRSNSTTSDEVASIIGEAPQHQCRIISCQSGCFSCWQGKILLKLTED